MILVTGGAGFIGSNFVLDWLAAGRVTVSAEGRVLLDGSDHPSSRTLIHPLLAGLSSTGGSGF